MPKGSHQGVRAKKHLGQHFLRSEPIAQKIAYTLTLNGYKNVIEIGPGTGVLTKYLLEKPIHLQVMEIDQESIAYLKTHFSFDHRDLVNPDRFTIMEADFLKVDLDSIFKEEPFAITGNFPYNISSQIVFKTITYRHRIPEFTGMFQKEVAQRICATHGSKTYGILSVLTQAFYDAQYLFTVPPGVFNPPPKVDSGVLRLTRKETYADIGCDPDFLFKVVKTAFQQRRKTLRNSLKSLNVSDAFRQSEIGGKRPEQLSIEDFIKLTKTIQDSM